MSKAVSSSPKDQKSATWFGIYHRGMLSGDATCPDELYVTFAMRSLKQLLARTRDVL